jgi:hypothetical protein
MKLDYLHKILIFICVVCIIITVATVASRQYIKNFDFTGVSNVSNVSNDFLNQIVVPEDVKVKIEDVSQQTQV